MNIQYLRYAVEVARTGSISQAAENLFISQPSLSRAIRELETSLGVRLFLRTGRGMRPTLEGEDLLQHARVILTQVEKIEALYQSNANSPIRFHLAATPSLYISVAFARFCTKVMGDNETRHANLSMHEMHRLEVIEAVESGMCDAGVLRCRSDEEMMFASILSSKGLDSMPLGIYHPCLAMAPNHPLANAESITHEMLMPYPRVTLDAGAVENLVLFESEVKHPDQDVNRISVFSRDSAVAILHAVPGACMPCSPLPQDVADLYQLVLRSVDGTPCRYRDLYIARSGTMQRRAEQMLLEELYVLQGGHAASST